MSEPVQACPFPYALTPAQAKVLLRAYRRPEHTVCPTPGLWAACQTAVLRVLTEEGYITGGGCPVLTEKGVAVAADLARKEQE